jgi:hypothetical protein
MFCPKCGQEQVSESLRFCSGCGFKLNTVEEGLLKRLMGMALYLVLTAAAIFGMGAISAGPNYMQLRFLITLLAVVTFYLLFSRDLRQVFHNLIKQGTSTTQETDLPPAARAVATLNPHRVTTAEIVPPPSVTEHTTSLLDRNQRST